MECSVHLAHMDCSHLNPSKDAAKSLNNCKPMASTLDGLPWIGKFKSMCLTNMNNSSSLINLMTYFIRNVRPTVNECQTKPLRADKLKGLISETLLFFMYYYRSQEASDDRTIYMDLMSDLLAMYIDLELKASKRSCEYHERISGRLASYLYIYLENSAEHLMDTILKIRFMSSTYYQIINPLLTKIFKIIPERPNTNLMYIRYFLVYRIWKRITKDANIKNEINSKALSSLKSYPTSLPQYVKDHVLPKVPNNQKISTRLLLTQHIELEKSCEAFIKYCKKSRVSKDSEDVEQIWLDDITELELEDNLPCKLNLSSRENNVRNVLLNNNENSHNSSNNQTKDSINSSIVKLNSEKTANGRVVSRNKIPKNNGEVLFIDLTAEDSNGKIIKQRKKNKKFSWIQKIFKRQSGIENNYEKDKNVKEDFRQFEETFNLQSLLITFDKTDIFDTEINTQYSECNSSEIDEASSTENKTVEENSQLELEKLTGAKIDTIVDPKAKIENQSSEDSENSKLECEQLAENLGDKIKVQTTEFVADEVEVTTSEPDNCTNTEIDHITERLHIYPCEDIDLIPKYNTEYDSDVNKNINSNRVSGSNNILRSNNCIEYITEKLDICAKISDADFHDHIDGLSLLASVSQRVSHLNAAARDVNTRELIKVKDYNSLRTYTDINGDQRSYDNQSESDANMQPRVYPDDDIDRLHSNREVSSTEDSPDLCTSSEIYEEQEQEREQVEDNSCLLNEPPNELPIELTSTSVQVESTITNDKDETNVILNGETIVLLQKSPNSNLYIINKAVENKDHGNEEDTAINLSEKNSILEKVKDENYSCEKYDSAYRVSQSYSSAAPYELVQETRRTNKVKIDPTVENIACHDSKISGKNNLDVMNPGRCRVKQEFNGCANGLSNHIGNTSYGNQNCASDLVDPHGLHIPTSSGLSGMYHSSYTTGDLYITCRQNCTPVACGISVNHPGPILHSRAKTQRCSCLNCAYGIVAHCNQYIIPQTEATATANIDAGYYIPVAQKPVIQECSVQSNHESNNINMCDNKLVCKIEAELRDEEQQPQQPQQHQQQEQQQHQQHQQSPQKKVYQPEVNNRLPLKKRFKSMLPIDLAIPLKAEQNDNTFCRTSMISIAAIESRNSLNSATTLITDINSPESIERDYGKDMIDDYHNYTEDRKRKRPDIVYSNDHSSELKITNEHVSKNTKRVKEQKPPKKHAAKKTRSSQRKVPKINYSYMDDEIDSNPSGEVKRKKKKLCR